MDIKLFNNKMKASPSMSEKQNKSNSKQREKNSKTV